MFAAVLRAIGHAVPDEGRAAFRFWGQAGQRSAAWIAAADPVHLQANLDRVRLHAFRADELPRPEWRELCNHLQEFLGDDQRYAIARLGPFAYLRSSKPIATANVPPDAIDGCDPGEFMPGGELASTHDRLLGEIQMALHEHEVNRTRAANGLPTVNSLWFWGGGIAPQQQSRSIPPLFADDPLIRGYWESSGGVIKSWTKVFDEAPGLAPGGFVAVSPHDSHAWPQHQLAECLANLRHLVTSGAVATLRLLGRDGLEIDIGRADAFRFWRRVSPLLLEAQHDD